jgi:hypothetical protein
MGYFSVVGSTSGNGLEIDSDHHMFVTGRPPAFGALGYYRLVVVSGAIAATLGANSDLFSFQWTNASDFAIIQSVKVSAVVASTITSAVNFDLAIFFARTFTAADTGGTSVLPTSNNQKMRTSMGTTLVNDMRISSTAALGAGTRTPDTAPLGRVQGNSGTATGTQFFSAPNPQPLYVMDNTTHHPICLKQNEGFVIQNPLAGPATGTFNVLVQVEWGEVAAY